MDRVRLALAVFVLSIAGPAAAQDACAGVSCSGHGACFEERGIGHCLCDEGYAAFGHSCMPGGPTEDAVLRARRDPDAARRVLAIAEAQVGRDRGAVGADLDRHPFALRGYLAPGEWWCGDFVSWVYEAAGVGFSGGSAGGWLVPNNVAVRAWFRARGLWIERGDPGWLTHEPRPGDYMRVHTELGGHAAIVHHVSGDTLYAIEGNVGTRVEMTRYYHFRTHRLIHGFGALALVNAPPTVDAGEDLSTTRRLPVRLRGEVEDDGPDARLSVRWSTAEGPAEADCERPRAAATECWLTEPGRYVLRLEARDGEHTSTDDVVIEVRENRAPIVDVTILDLDPRGRTARLVATATDDEPLALRWAFIAGPAGADFEDSAAASTAVRFGAPGIYDLRLTADDGELTSVRDVRVELPAPSPFGCAIAPARSRAPRLAFGLGLGLALAWIARRARSLTRQGAPRSRRS